MSKPGGFIGVIVGVVLDACLAFGMASAAIEDAPNQDDALSTDLAIDVTSAEEMHAAGLPTKTDVITWHIYGHWGFAYTIDGVYTVENWEGLPGGAEIWDKLYGIDTDNESFRF